ncbi:MAG TPA: transcriptional regulator [Sphingomicrobium sp.]|nr:transcriptional regulator [Sphingomicrobium sp.]
MLKSYRFDRFELDPADRRLTRDGEPVELNARYFDALALMVRESGRLVSKDRFLSEVWRGVPVTDEALTQCVRSLRSQLGDDAANPRFIETVPKHGYRFIAPVEGARELAPQTFHSSRDALMLGAAGTIGGGIAGFIGGLVYGFAGASQPLLPGMGAVSVLLVLLCACILVAIMGGAGVAFGIAVAGRGRSRAWPIVGGASGGFLIGAIVKLLGLDAFSLLIGRSPGDITGPFEGLIVGAAVGIAYVAAGFLEASERWKRIAVALLCGALGGGLVALLGGHMMGGSLDLLAQSFPGSRLRLDRVGGWFGEGGFGPVTRLVTASLEGALFAAGVVTAMRLARRNRTP